MSTCNTNQKVCRYLDLDGIYRKNIRIDKRQVVMYVTSIKDYLLLDEVQFMSRFEEVLE